MSHKRKLTNTCGNWRCGTYTAESRTSVAGDLKIHGKRDWSRLINVLSVIVLRLFVVLLSAHEHLVMVEETPALGVPMFSPLPCCPADTVALRGSLCRGADPNQNWERWWPGYKQAFISKDAGNRGERRWGSSRGKRRSERTLILGWGDGCEQSAWFVSTRTYVWVTGLNASTMKMMAVLA